MKAAPGALPNAATSNNRNFVNRSKLWQICFFALNNTATNLYAFAMGFSAYYATGIAGLLVVVVSTLGTATRIFDGFTDPVIGYVIDKTKSRIGKFRPFMLLGNLILAITVLLMFNITHILPTEWRLPFFIAINAVYIIGYTFQTACTKAAQTVLTNDPKQRPVFVAFDASYNTLLFVGGQYFIASILVPKHGGFNLGFFAELNTIVIITSAIFTILAVIGIWNKDRLEYYGFAEKNAKVSIKDYWPVIRRNRPLQMLIVAASTDKLAASVIRQPVVPVIFFGLIIGDYALSGTISLVIVLPTLLLTFFGIGLARKRGLKLSFVAATWGALATYALLMAVVIFGTPQDISLSNLGFMTLAFLVLYTLGNAFMGVTGNMVIPMIADATDYELHLTGRYAPGMIGTLFSFVDKIISSFGITIVGIFLAAIGFKNAFPEVDTPLTTSLYAIGLFFMFGIPILGWIASIVAMKFYKLDHRKMEQIQSEIAEVKQALADKNEISIPDRPKS